MQNRPHRMTPAMRRQWLLAAGSAVMGVFILASDYYLTDGFTWRAASGLLILGAAIYLFKEAAQGIAANDYAFYVTMGSRRQQVRFDLVESFQWQNNLENLGRKGQRLWIVLTDGQKVPTPVTTGATSFLKPEVGLSDSDADALIRNMEARLPIKSQI